MPRERWYNVLVHREVHAEAHVKARNKREAALMARNIADNDPSWQQDIDELGGSPWIATPSDIIPARVDYVEVSHDQTD